MRRCHEHRHAVAVRGRTCAVLAPSQRRIVAEISVIDQIVSAGIGRLLKLYAVKISCAGSAILHSRCKCGDVASGSVRICDLHTSPICVSRDRGATGNDIPGRHQDKLGTRPASAHAGSLHISRERVTAVSRTMCRLCGFHAETTTASRTRNGQRSGTNVTR